MNRLLKNAWAELSSVVESSVQSERNMNNILFGATGLSCFFILRDYEGILGFVEREWINGKRFLNSPIMWLKPFQVTLWEQTYYIALLVASQNKTFISGVCQFRWVFPQVFIRVQNQRRTYLLSADIPASQSPRCSVGVATQQLHGQLADMEQIQELAFFNSVLCPECRSKHWRGSI